MMTTLGKAAALTTVERRLLCEAFVMVVRARVVLSIVPWRRLPESMRVRAPSTRVAPNPDRLEWAVRNAARLVPCASCLTQALALHRLFSFYRYQSVVQVGVRNADGQFTAHAWVETEGRSRLATRTDIERYSRCFIWSASRLDQL
jgi:hypothetical protein